MLTEYYKFHNDVPRVVELGVEKIMGRYYDKRRGIDYKKIKKVLKEEQGISISSAGDGLSSMDDSAQEQGPKRSKYTTLLSVAQEEDPKKMEESQLFREVCGQMDHLLAHRKLHSPLGIRGRFHPPDHFEQFLKEQ